MAQLIASRSVTINAANPILQSPTVDLDPLTASITVRLQRPTTAQPLSWNTASRLRVTIVCIVDGTEYRCVGHVSGGIRTGPGGTEVSEYAITYNTPVMFGKASRDFIETATRDAEGFYNDVPMVRLGESGKTIQGYLLLERISGTINTVITVAGTVESEAPKIRYKNSVAFDAATSTVEENGDGVLSLNHTATGSNLAAFIGVGIRTATMGAGTTSYAGGGGSVTSIFSIEDAGFEGGLYGFYKTAPATSSQSVSSDITAVTPSDHFLGVITMTGVDQTTPVGTAATEPFGFDTSPSVTVGSVAAGDMVVDLLLDQLSPTVGANQTARWTPAATGYPSYFRGSTQAGGDGGVMSWTHTGSTSRALGAVAFKEATGGGGRTTKNTLAAPLGMEIGMNWRGGE